MNGAAINSLQNNLTLRPSIIVIILRGRKMADNPRCFFHEIPELHLMMMECR